MAKCALATDGTLVFWCPGCGHPHGVRVNRPDLSPNWGFNGDIESPTLDPSVLVHPHPGQPRCHSFVRAGMIEFLADCTHPLTGQTVDLPDWETAHRG